jgi:hypothetical protein
MHFFIRHRQGFKYVSLSTVYTRVVFHSVFNAPLHAFLDIGFHIKVNFICLVPIFNERQCGINIINLHLSNNGIALLQFAIIEHRDFNTIEKTPDKPGIAAANIRHQLFKNRRIRPAIGVQKINANQISL